MWWRKRGTKHTEREWKWNEKEAAPICQWFIQIMLLRTAETYFKTNRCHRTIYVLAHRLCEWKDREKIVSFHGTNWTIERKKENASQHPRQQLIEQTETNSSNYFPSIYWSFHFDLAHHFSTTALQFSSFDMYKYMLLYNGHYSSIVRFDGIYYQALSHSSE